jgi:ArsR family transcriptional regulator
MQNLLREYKASLFHTLAHPTRIAIVEALLDGEVSAGGIQDRLGVEQSNLSQHLASLRSRQIVANLGRTATRYFTPCATRRWSRSST